MINVREIKLTDVYEEQHASLSASPRFGGLVDFIVPDDTPHWTDYRAVGDTTDGCALTTNRFGYGIQYGEYVDEAKATGYGTDKRLSVLHFTCYDTYGEHTLRRWASGNGMTGAAPLETISLVDTYDPLTNGSEYLAWIATDSFLITAMQWDAVTQRKMHLLERFTAGVSAWNTIEEQDETYDPMLPPNKMTSTFYAVATSKEYEIKLRGRCSTHVHQYEMPNQWGPDETPTEFMLQVSTELTFATSSLIETYLIPVDEDLHENGYAQTSYTNNWYLNILAADTGLPSRGFGDNLLGEYFYIVDGTGVGQSGFVWDVENIGGGVLQLEVSPQLTTALDATSQWEFRYKQGTKNIIIPASTTTYIRFAQRRNGGAWSGWEGQDSIPNMHTHLYDLGWGGQESDLTEWIRDFYIDWNKVCYSSHIYTGTASVWRIKVNDKDWAATHWRIEGSESSDFTDDPIPFDETDTFVNYIQGCTPIRADAILDLTAPANGWYVRARGESDDGLTVSAWSESVFVKTGESNQSHSYVRYVPSYVGERTKYLNNGLVVTTTNGYALFNKTVNSVLNQAQTSEEETLFLLPISFSGVLGTPVTVVTYAGYLNYQPSLSVSGNMVYVAYYVDATHLYWKSYNTATSTLTPEHEVVLPTGYAELGYGTIWQSGGLLFTAVFDYGPPSTAHLAYVDTAVSDTLQVLGNTHADDGGMQGWSGWGFWYPFVTDYDAYQDYGVAFLSVGQSNAIWFVNSI
jgi:hypothetical protein